MGVQLTTRQMYLKFLSFIAIKYYLGGESKFIYLISYFPKSLIQTIIDNNKITLDQDLPPSPPNLLSKVPLKYADGEREGNPIMKEILLLILVQVPWFGIPYKSIHFL